MQGWFVLVVLSGFFCLVFCVVGLLIGVGWFVALRSERWFEFVEWAMLVPACIALCIAITAFKEIQ
jgi:hypothetical protein